MIRSKLYSMFLLAAGIFSMTSCTQPKASVMLQDDARKNDIIAAILVNDAVSSELLDSFMIRRHDQVMMKMNAMMGGDASMQGDAGMKEGMMDKMIGMCKEDSSMCKMMFNKTMAMCDADQASCKMMMSSMEAHPNVMKSVEGMCNMKGMKMDPKK